MSSADDGALVDRLRSVVGSAAGAGGLMPSEPTLAAELGASRPALREALMRLEVEGLVSRRRGAPTTINRAAQSIPARFDQQVEFVDVIEASGQRAEVEVIEAAYVEVDAETAALLDVEVGARAFRTVKRWTADGVPVLVAVDVVLLLGGDPGDPPPDLDPQASLFDNVVPATGRDVEWEVARPSAVVASGEVTGWIGAEDRPLLVLDLLGVSRTGDRLYRALEYHVPGAVEFGFVRTIERAPRATPRPG